MYLASGVSLRFDVSGMCRERERRSTDEPTAKEGLYSWIDTTEPPWTMLSCWGEGYTTLSHTMAMPQNITSDREAGCEARKRTNLKQGKQLKTCDFIPPRRLRCCTVDGTAIDEFRRDR